MKTVLAIIIISALSISSIDNTDNSGYRTYKRAVLEYERIIKDLDKLQIEEVNYLIMTGQFDKKKNLVD